MLSLRLSWIVIPIWRCEPVCLFICVIILRLSCLNEGEDIKWLYAIKSEENMSLSQRKEILKIVLIYRFLLQLFLYENLWVSFWIENFCNLLRTLWKKKTKNIKIGLCQKFHCSSRRPILIIALPSFFLCSFTYVVLGLQSVNVALMVNWSIVVGSGHNCPSYFTSTAL